MIAYIKGQFTYKSPTHVIMESHGLGYHVNISLNTYEKVQSLDHGLLHIHFHVKEDAHTLYGFFSEGERRMFQHLISVSGVGPNTARMMLSSMEPIEIQQAIVLENVKLLQSIKGIGPKSAQRIILELKDKVSRENLPTAKGASGDNSNMEDALSALSALGISRPLAQRALSKAVKELNSGTVEGLVKTALKLL